MGAQKLLAIQPSFLCPYPGFAMDTVHSPGMQYLKGGAMTATKSQEKQSRLLIG